MIQISEINDIPNHMGSDWKIFEYILFHLVQNAIKFNKLGGSISFDMSYHELAIPGGCVFDEAWPTELDKPGKKNPTKDLD